MRFVPWYPLEAFAAHTPASPGVFQIRVCEGLIDYPSGKSAMIQYGASADLRRAVGEFQRENPGVPWLCRHSVEMSREERENPGALLAKLLLLFRNRFGALPAPPTSPASR